MRVWAGWRVFDRRTLRMQPTRSGGMSDRREMAAASRSAKRFSEGVALSSSFARHVTRAFCTSSHVQKPPTRWSYICCVFDAFSA